MKTPDHDPDWEALLARLAHADGDQGAAERLLRGAGEAAPPAGWIEATVAAAASRRRGLRAAGRRRLALLLPLSLLLAAAVTLTLLWPEGHHSATTMTFAQAIELLHRPDQPLEHRQSALFVTEDRARFGLLALARIRDDAKAPAALRAAARDQLEALRVALADPAPATPAPVDEGLAAAADAAADADRPLAERSQQLAHAARLTASAILAIVGVRQSDPDLREDCDAYLERLAARLR